MDNLPSLSLRLSAIRPSAFPSPSLLLLPMLCSIPVFLITLSLLSCSREPRSTASVAQKTNSGTTYPARTNTAIDYDTTQWTELTKDDGYFIDIKYATEDNFVNEAVYPCGRCFLKPKVAKEISRIRDELS